MHSYLPLSHDLFYGADGWRHMASVQRLISGLPLTEAATSGGTWFLHILGIVAYSHLWGVLLIGNLLGFSLITVTAWFVPLAWSLVIPLVLFRLGKECAWSEKTSLAFAFGSLIPFALTAGGSFTLPNSLGFIVFLPSLLLIARRLKTGERRWVMWLGLYGVFLLTGYTLYAIIFWLLWGAGEVVLRLSTRTAKPFVSIAMVLVVACFVPVLECAAGYSRFPTSPRFVLAAAQQLVGNLTGFYLAFGPRPHAIATGNILLYQTPSYAFIPNLFTEGRYWLALISTLLWLFALIGLLRSFKSVDRVERWLSIVTFGLFGSYGIGRYLLTGEQVLSRRLDLALAFFALFVVVNEGSKRLEALKVFSWQRYYVVGIVMMLSVFGAAVYSLGPVDRAVSRDEYRAAEYVWSTERFTANGHYCIVADTYPLLALEALSAKRIVGGGFPIDQYFAQKEREEIYALLQQKFSQDIWLEAARATGADHCWFVGAVKNSSETSVTGNPTVVFGDLSVRRFDVTK